MPQQIRRRELFTLNFAAGQQKTDRFEIGEFIRYLVVNLQFVIDAAANTIGPTTLRPGDEWAVIEQLEIIANGSDVLVSLTGEELKMLNLLWFDGAPRLTTAWSADTANAVTVNSNLSIPFWSPKSGRPIDTAVESSRLVNLTARIRWGTAASVTSAASAAFTTDPTATISAVNSFDPEGKLSQLFQRRIGRLQFSGVPLQKKYAIDLAPGQIYRSILLHSKDGSGNDLAEKIDRVVIRSGGTVFWDWRAKSIRDTYLQHSGIEELTIGYSSNSKLDAWTLLDFVEDGRLTEALDATSYGSLVMEIDTNATINELYVLPITLQPLPQRMAAAA